MYNDIGQPLLLSLNASLSAVITFIPKFVAGLAIILLGIIIASVVKQALLSLFKALNLEGILSRYGVPEAKREFSWSNLLAETARWFVVIMFLIPTADVWGLPQIVTILNTFLLYLPNVFVAAIIALVGLVFARLASDLVHASAHGLSPEAANSISSVTRWAITVFVLLAVLNQLGVASDLIKILFTGFVAMVAIAGGIAFGLGGQGVAKDTLESIRKKLK